MDKKLSNFLEQREHTVLTDIDVITAAVAVPWRTLATSSLNPKKVQPLVSTVVLVTLVSP